MRHAPSRHHVRTTAATIGLIAAGLLVPQTVGAQTPVTPPTYPYRYATTPASSLPFAGTPVTGGLFVGDFGGGARSVVTVAGRGADAGTALMTRTAASGGTLHDAVTAPSALGDVAAVTSGALNGTEPQALSAVAVGTDGDDTSRFVLTVADWHDGGRFAERRVPLTGAPVGVAVGRFLPFHGTVIAVSAANGTVEFYEDPDRTGPRQVAVVPMPAGPLLTVPGVGVDDLLVAPDTPVNGSTPTARRAHVTGVIDPNTDEPAYQAELTTTTSHLFSAPNTMVSAPDAVGRRWYGGGTGPTSLALEGFDPAPGLTGQPLHPIFQFLTTTDRTAAVVGDLFGHGALDGVAFTGPTGGGAWASLTTTGKGSFAVRGSAAVATDADADGRDDLVVLTGAKLQLFRTTTGDAETKPQLAVDAVTPRVVRPSTNTPVVTSRTFEFTPPASDTALYEYVVADGAPVTSRGPQELTAPADGTVALRVRRKEQGLNFWSPATTLTLTVDTSRPDAPTPTVAPSALTRVAHFELPPVAATERLEHRIDDGTWTTFAGVLDPTLADGPHTVSFRTVDELGRPSAETDVRFVLDTTPPKAPIALPGPTGDTTDRIATIAADVEQDATPECRVDDGDWEPCLLPLQLRDLALGTHRVDVRQVDPAGNPSAPATWTWRVVEPTVELPASEQPAPTPSPADPSTGKGPQPAPTPAGAPQPATTPRPAAVPSATSGRDADAIPTARLTVGGTPAKGRTATTTATGRSLTVGCSAPGAKGYRCSVTVTRGGRTVGEGRRTGAGAVPVSLDEATARKVQRLGGLRVRVTLTVRTADGETTKTQKTVRILPRKVLVVPTDGLFAFDSAVPSAEGRRLARTLAAQLDGARTVTIVGHTDARGRASVNLRLGQERADAFRRLLRQHDVRAEVVTRSAGDTEPRATNASDAGRALNRRVEVEVRY